ncbi:MAG: hypothetical protein HC836_38030 [Richelia sp. RM2_1_2]|nr:hypothetical protein [Richelia sp. SM2_1_7]NJM20859.1 hypothetical protein [Richelia sp. SM1_7_0]NJN08594.1 hypothetical protein [Richelia sp. RM1_1_1]NJO29092.1 hypothetical protein [Richelia sp. SL_2_1]NJO63778.1 hypothetical protein [Richelia sp. RM2_1_2]
MSEEKDKKLPIKIKKSSCKSQEEELSKPCESENHLEERKVRKTIITTEISSRPKIVGAIPPWDDSDDDSQQDDQIKPPTITTEIPTEPEKFNQEFEMTPRATGEIPPWDEEEESK